MKNINLKKGEIEKNKININLSLIPLDNRFQILYLDGSKNQDLKIFIHDPLYFLEKENQNFILFDSKENILYLRRSFFSKIPIYFSKIENKIIWSNSLSEILKDIKIKPKLNPIALNLFFRLTYIPPPYTIYNNIYKLPADHVLKVNCTTLLYDTISLTKKKDNFSEIDSFEKAKKKIYNQIMESVNMNMQKDFGSFLSGGIDSSIISTCFAELQSKPIHTFSLGFENSKYDETKQASLIAERINSNHHKFILRESETASKIPEILSNFEEPFADSSAIPSYYLAKKAKKIVPGVLTGDGGDEIFGGYNKYYIGKLNRSYTRIIPKFLHNRILKTTSSLLRQKTDNRGKAYRINKTLNAINYEGNFFYNIISLGFLEDDLRNIFKKKYFVNRDVFEYYKKMKGDNLNQIKDFREIDYMISLQGDMIPKVYIANQSAGLLYASPFLQKSLWTYTNTLPDNFLIKGWNKKFILKEAFKEKFPVGFFNNPKTGFGIPVGDWLRNELKEELLNFIDKDFIQNQGIFEWKNIHDWVMQHVLSVQDASFQVWTFYCFQRWYIDFHLRISK